MSVPHNRQRSTRFQFHVLGLRDETLLDRAVDCIRARARHRLPEIGQRRTEPGCKSLQVPLPEIRTRRVTLRENNRAAHSGGEQPDHNDAGHNNLGFAQRTSSKLRSIPGVSILAIAHESVCQVEDIDVAPHRNARGLNPSVKQLNV